MAFLGGKPVFLLSTSPGKWGGAANLGHLSEIAPRWGAKLVGHHSIGSWNKAFDAERGELTRAEDRDAVMAGLASLQAHAAAAGACGTPAGHIGVRRRVAGVPDKVVVTLGPSRTVGPVNP
jgi:NAD(P)H-dependent FMN reductase